MLPRSRVCAKLRSTRSARSFRASLATPERSRARLPYTARCASRSPCQRWTPFGWAQRSGSATGRCRGPSAFPGCGSPYPPPGRGASASGPRLLPPASAAASRVPCKVVVSPSSAGWTSAATTAPVSRSTAAPACRRDGSGRLSSGRSSLRIGGASPLGVRGPLAFARPVELLKLSRLGRGDPAFLGHPPEHFSSSRRYRVGLPTSCGIASRSRINANPPALDQAMLGQPLQHPREHLASSGVALGSGQPECRRAVEPEAEEVPERGCRRNAPASPRSLALPSKCQPGTSGPAPSTARSSRRIGCHASSLKSSTRRPAAPSAGGRKRRARHSAARPTAPL